VQAGAYRVGDLRCAIATLFATPPSLRSGAPYRGVIDRWDLGTWPPPEGGVVPLEAAAQRRRGCLVLGRPESGRGCLIENPPVFFSRETPN
jgi:hypothetical protein